MEQTTIYFLYLSLIHILIDCETGAMGQGLLVETAVTLRDEGKSAKEIADTIQALLKKTATYIVVDSLEYLKRGGRISKSAALLGGLMKVHPVLQVIADGAKPIDKVKGKKSANAWLINNLKDQPADENYKLVIGNSNAPERAKAFEEQLREAGIKNEIMTTCIGPDVYKRQTQSSTTFPSASLSFFWFISCWYCPTPILFGSIFTSSASGSCSRLAIETALLCPTSKFGNSSVASLLAE